jgi:5-methylcytosine-specific restriction endonuclease McrA
MPPSYPWFKFYAETVHDVKLLRCTAAQRWVWVAMLCAACESAHDGELWVGGEPMTESDLARYASVSRKTVVDALAQFARMGMVERTEEGAWRLANWSARQEKSTSAERQHRYRQKRERLEQLAERDGYLCHLCGEPVDMKIDAREDRGPTLDHLVSRSQGGWEEPSNLRLAHRGCNLARGTREVEEARRYISDNKRYATPVTEGEAEAEAEAEAEKIFAAAPQNADIVPITRKRDELWEVLLYVASIDAGSIPETQRKILNRQCKELRDIGATPDDVLARATNFRLLWPDIPLTVQALVRQWAKCTSDAVLAKGKASPSQDALTQIALEP